MNAPAHRLPPAAAAGAAGWTDERVDALKALNAKGLSASQIAKQLGGISRNGVIGKLNRLGIGLKSAVSVRRAAELRRLEPKPAPVARAVRQDMDHNKRGDQAGFAPRPEPPPEIAPADDRARLTLAQLTAHVCRWPVGEPGHPDFGFCGLDAPVGPYCAGHAARAFDRRVKTRTPAELAADAIRRDKALARMARSFR